MRGFFCPGILFWILPRRREELKPFLKRLPLNHTHVCIEAPYRTDALLKNLIAHLPNAALLSVAWDLTLPTQGVCTQKVFTWKKNIPILGKVPAVFLFRLI